MLIRELLLLMMENYLSLFTEFTYSDSFFQDKYLPKTPLDKYSTPSKIQYNHSFFMSCHNI